MGTISKEYANDLTALICDMGSEALRQILFAMVNDLKKNPSVLKDRFVELVLDGVGYQRVISELRPIGGP